MMSPERRRVALVTGGTRGIGLGIARCLAAEATDLVVCGVRAESEALPALEELREAGARVVYAQADVAEPAARARLLALAREQLGALHVLVNNAGITSLDRDRDLLEAREESFERLLRVNLQAPYFLTRDVAHWMIAQRESDPGFAGCIVNITSVSAELVSVNRGDYCVSKAGLSMATRLWAVRLAQYGIPVYEVRPGLIRSDMTAPAAGRYDQAIAEGLLLQPRWGEPEDVGRAVAALARGELAYSSGHAITVDGGLSVHRF
jgi:3-oxoacyl-[acyl-carrier protein] reductase